MTLISHCRYEVMAIIHCIYTHCRLRIQSSIRIKLYMISCTKLHLAAHCCPLSEVGLSQCDNTPTVSYCTVAQPLGTARTLSSHTR